LKAAWQVFVKFSVFTCVVTVVDSDLGVHFVTDPDFGLKPIQQNLKDESSLRIRLSKLNFKLKKFFQLFSIETKPCKVGICIRIIRKFISLSQMVY
jgi:hypothetical protein